MRKILTLILCIISIASYGQEVVGNSCLSRGYRGFVEFDFKPGLNADEYKMSASTIHGYQFNPNFFLGYCFSTNIWCGDKYWYEGDLHGSGSPVATTIASCVDMRFDFKRKSKTAYGEVRIGIHNGDFTGFYTKQIIGYRFNRFNVFAAMETATDGDEFKCFEGEFYPYDHQCFGKCSFGVGVSFEWGAR